MAETKTPAKLADDATFEDLDALPAGAVRAFGRIGKGDHLAFVQWQDGKLTDGTIDGKAAVEAAVKHEVIVRLPAVYVGTASVTTKAEFMATAYDALNDCEFSEEFVVTLDNDADPN